MAGESILSGAGPPFGANPDKVLGQQGSVNGEKEGGLFRKSDYEISKHAWIKGPERMTLSMLPLLGQH